MITVKIDQFEGPLDLLLHLIQQAEVDIYDISIAEIADQYVTYIRAMQELELDIASEFLVMASKLLAMKSSMLLPRTHEPEAFEDSQEEPLDPRQELIERLLEYKKFKQLAEQLRDNEAKQHKLFSRAPEDLSAYMAEEDPNPVRDLSLFHLLDALQDALERNKQEPLRTIEREEISLDDRMQEVRSYLALNRRVSFSQLLRGRTNRSQIVVTFLALLEMMKNRLIVCRQEQLFDDISISLAAEGDEHVF